jgi:UDPglucose--hexose-1-phosphate uridylyltransferase
MTTSKETSNFYHWHLEVYPKLATWAGFEKSTGVYINTMTPETAAESLREASSN